MILQKRPSLESVFGEMPPGSVFEKILKNLEQEQEQLDRSYSSMGINWGQNTDDDRSKPDFGGLLALRWHGIAFEIVPDYLKIIMGWNTNTENSEKLSKRCAIILSFFLIGSYELARHLEETDLEKYLESLHVSMIANFFLPLHREKQPTHAEFIYKTANSYVQWLTGDEQDSTKRFVEELRKILFAVAVIDKQNEMRPKLLAHLAKYYEMYEKQFNVS
jgi:hypothetical protein